MAVAPSSSAGLGVLQHPSIYDWNRYFSRRQNSVYDNQNDSFVLRVLEHSPTPTTDDVLRQFTGDEAETVEQSTSEEAAEVRRFCAGANYEIMSNPVLSSHDTMLSEPWALLDDRIKDDFSEQGMRARHDLRPMSFHGLYHELRKKVLLLHDADYVFKDGPANIQHY